MGEDNNNINGGNRSDTIFNGLSTFGLDGALDAKVYINRDDQAKEAAKNYSDRNGNAERFIFLKIFKCPVCGVSTKVPAIRSSHIRLERHDTDFMPIYKDPNPLYYFVVFCKSCGFSAIPAHIKNMSAKSIQLIREKISATWSFEKEYPLYYTPQIAVELHKLALYNAVVAGEKESVRAILCLHTGWLYRIAGDPQNEKLFLTTAREGFERAYEYEQGPVGGLDIGSQQYLIGELLRRTGNLYGALKWYKLVLTNRGAKHMVKNMAREQRDAIMAGYESNKSANRDQAPRVD